MTELGKPTDQAPLLEVDGLRTSFSTPGGLVKAVDGVSLEVNAGQTVGIVGESGSGKSVFVRTIMGLISWLPGATVGGQVTFDGRDVATLTKRERRHFWGSEMAMIFQDPMTSLNPVKKIGAHLVEPLRLHLSMSKREARKRAVELLDEVGIPEPARRLAQYPHELSGGMRQRVCIALALSCRPRLLIADEPTTALDVTVQRQILDLIETVTSETNMATIMITHDLGVVAKRAEKIMVMYAGRTAEVSDARSLFHSPHHPYTEALLGSVPRLSEPPHTRLAAIGGRPPDLTRRLVGCPFAPRCRYAQDDCTEITPPLRSIDEPDHRMACHHPVNAPEVADTDAKAGVP